MMNLTNQSTVVLAAKAPGMFIFSEAEVRIRAANGMKLVVGVYKL
jgi:hypothetical protein